ncbi:MAG TPA: hypothetical protein VLW26_12180 [Steroidobacteraceae bacterium]|nr:hypothetical protein [Steroidobacteraceae bacterium]
MTTFLNDLTQRLAIVAAQQGYSVAVKLHGGTHGTRLELKAQKPVSGGQLDYAQHVSLAELEHKGPVAVAEEFARQVRVAMSTTTRLNEEAVESPLGKTRRR